MKKILIMFCCLSIIFLGTACQSETEVRAGHIAEITGALSTDYAIKVTLDKDDRVDEKYVDLQIKSSEDEQILTFGEENSESYVIFVPKKDYWYNLTYLISQANGISDGESYKKYEDFGSRVFMFKAQNDVDLTFRVVAGQTKTNKETKEEILVLGEAISEEVTVKMKKSEKK